jgi:hypothetical protein
MCSKTFRETTALLVGLVLLAGCGGSPQTCTDIGAVSGVMFDVSEVLKAHPRQALLVRACVEDTCDSLRVGRHRRQPGFGSVPTWSRTEVRFE